jgi:hypothetical protein
MTDPSTNRSVDDRPESENENPEQASFWADHLLQFNRSFALGHPYLQGQWGQYQADKRAHIIKSLLTAIALIAVGVCSTRLMFYWLYYIVPIVCIGYGFFSLRKWNKKNAQLSAREKELTAASEVLRDGTTALVQYSVEDIGQSKMHVLKNAVPYCRILIEGATSVPKYCGSWPIRNWRRLSESDELTLQSDYRSYSTGKVWHAVDKSFALLTDTGTVLWFV